MPTYVYKCPMCKEEYLDFQHKFVGSRKIECPKGCWYDRMLEIRMTLKRDYAAERPSVISDWEPGYNPGIDYHYSSKSDLLAEIKRRGFYPSVHGNGIAASRAKPGLYGEEEYKHIYDYSKPDVTVPVNEEEG